MDMTLPLAPLTARQGLTTLAALLGGEDTRLVGGAVRDGLLGLPVADIDLATTLAPAEVMRRLDEAGIKAVPTGLAHGTVTAVLPSGAIEVTTLRRDVATDGRHAIVAYTSDWQQDAARRDFTINALYADSRDGRVFDYFDGLADLAARRVRFIGDPYRRIAEDHLRILRFFRFQARFGDAIDEAGLDACAVRANDLMALSRERIAAELLKLLVAPSAARVIALMVDRAILAPVIPEIDDDGVARLDQLVRREAAAAISPQPIRRLAALLSPNAAEAVGARLKLSNADRKRLIGATAGIGSEGPLGLAYRESPAAAIDRLLLAGEDIEPLRGWQPPRLPITGGALVARGLTRGPMVAATLQAVEARWIAEDFPGAARVDQIADEAVAAALGSSTASASPASSGREK